ncbi:MAG: aminopeptidase [Bacteroidia bacterium]
MFRILRFLVWEVFMLVIVLGGACYQELVRYGIAQGRGQLKIVMGARPVSEMLNTPAFPDSLKKKLRLIEEIRKYAVDSLGMKHSDNYTTVYDQHGHPILWTVTASEPFKLKPKEWHFPLLGSVSYKGFFDYKKGKKEADELRSRGYDVDYGGVGGWSTLGWFKDPILSSMLTRNEGSIANLILHELTHGTIYLKSSVDYNENLASFIGDKGAEKFLLYKYGLESIQYKEYETSKADRKVFNEYILHGAERLDSLYKTFSEGGNVKGKETKKMEMIEAIVDGVDKLELYHKRNYKSYVSDALDEKNAFFMSFRRYDSKYEVFDKEFKEVYGSNIKRYLQALVQREKK